MRFPRAALLFLTALCAPALSACAHGPLKPLPKEHADMTLPEAVTGDKITLSAEEIGNRFLKLIEGLESRDDLSPERIREVMGITLKKPDPAELSVAYWSIDLQDGWRYAFTYVPESPSLLKGVDLTFQNDKDDWSNMSAVCGLDFDHYDKALKAMGFNASPTYGPIGQLEDWRYTKFAKDGVGGDIVISVVPRNIVVREPGRLCVKSIGTLN
ncbi:hypothetical protein XAP3CFBP6996_000350 [Xanthomonas citri pv. fuscans CFBP 6996]|uniref:hypothetical protein n=1 Tax=Xanthomonas citri TaxID=346 RepID=UPI000C198FBD|nr:hypothetical protein [Xanthomonas citri]ATS49899.1 hypothetical protein XcfCFBP6992P_02435 [Xanthomonas citri pv. phaseoli var. fuscans]ATS55632.2 hypothetical protein XcfCFBP6994P_11165 [Xanthomonas citri pv. phaseoli var. fuscans]ATS60353.1 hypothetical protein XcfCFBP6996P_14575 [Xanthomonas citri pv. phaseoli var. fuscans]PTY30584.1 hypothetical protein XAP3CFBP6996_000350 [Xanthomonas citri pv. fuscans CFBP 6996]QWN14520.1 hypothetical protein DGN02_00355 [Xanthomonas citri]